MKISSRNTIIIFKDLFSPKHSHFINLRFLCILLHEIKFFLFEKKEKEHKENLSPHP